MVKIITQKKINEYKGRQSEKQSKLILIFICIFTFSHGNSKPIFDGAILN